MAQHYGVDVFGIDLSTNTIALAKEYWASRHPAIKHRVQFHVEDATKMAYPENFYDVVYSRDTILHIQDNLHLFKMFEKCLKPGGKLVISDYCCGDGEHSQEFQRYVEQRGYHLITVDEYGMTLENAGFADVVAVNDSKYFKEILNKELKVFESIKDEVIAEYSKDDYDYICNRWQGKMCRVESKEQVWGYFAAKKMFTQFKCIE